LYFSDEFIEFYEKLQDKIRANNDNVILSKKILLLNGFLKKSTKDYISNSFP